jgi:predicted transport protein
MAIVTAFKPEIIPIKGTPGLGEKWLQDQIANDPSILGLGELDLKDRERIQPGAGRLDLLLQDPDTNRRYEVEIQLGKTDESHIIRTIEYWDIEQQRYPHLDHCAVLVAEDITSRFLNVIKLFNRSLPLIAIKLQAIKVGEEIGLIFTTVLDELPRGLPDDGIPPEAKDRPYWETKGSSKTVKLADRMLGLIQSFAPGFELNYNKHYIGLALNGKAINFVIFRPQKSALRLEVSLPKDDERTAKLENVGLEVLEYDAQFGYYKIRLSAEDLDKHQELLVALMKEAYLARVG